MKDLFGYLPNYRRRVNCLGLLLFLSLVVVRSANAETVELSISGHWTAGDFKVIGKGDASFDPLNPAADGKVFDLAPSDGELTLVLHITSDMALFFPKGSQTEDNYGRTYSLTHDFFGYREVALVGGTYSFGGAVWKTEGVLTGLEGPAGSKATLWTDVDITKGNPTRVSFRMFGKAGSLSADLAVGPRTPDTILKNFVLWEYYNGEEIRSKNYSVSTKFLREMQTLNKT